MEAWVILILVSYLAATISGVAGFGGALLLLPFLTNIVGIKEAIPILTIAQIFGNLSRVTFSFSKIAWRPVIYFMIGSIPASYFGSRLFISADKDLITKIIGGVILAIVIWRRLKLHATKLTNRYMTVGGLASGFLSGLSGVGGPIAVLFFLGYGLTGSALIASEAMTATMTHLTKTFIYSSGHIITSTGLLYGSVLGITMVFGSWTGKKIIDKLSKDKFLLLVEIILAITGLWFILK